MESLIAIVSVVVGVLTIILFFKIWGMTNNIKKIKDAFIAANIKHGDIQVGDIVIQREENDASEVLEVLGDSIRCKSLTSNAIFTLKKNKVFVINQK